jgi:uncharacterized protein (UPF0332 family)
LAFDPKDFYELALWLVSQRQDEASLRTAISKVYYAAHHIAKKQLVQKMSWTPRGFGDDHSGVISKLKGSRFRSRGDELKSLQELREHADYHLDASITVGNQEWCSFCKKIRRSDNATERVVTDFHWREALTLSNRCIPLLEKI